MENGQMLDARGFDHTQDGEYRNVKTGKLVVLRGIRHFTDGTGRIEACYWGTRNGGQRFGRAFSLPIESFFERYVPATA
jgi:hypothetical protein